MRILNENPDFTLPQFFANEELFALEVTRGPAIKEGLAKSKKLILLKDQLLPICANGSVIAAHVSHPYKSMVRDPARIFRNTNYLSW